MTLIGFSVTPTDAFVWADTETYNHKRHLEGKPARHKLKIALNGRADVVSVGAGDVGGNRHIGEATEFADSFDHLCRGLPAFLRSEAVDRLDACDEWPPWTCAAAGWSHRFNRMMGVVFEARFNFSESYIAEYSMPRLSEFESLHPRAPADILSYAQSQMRCVQRLYPLAGAGAVTIAHIRRGSLSVSSFDLVTGHESAGLPKLPPMNWLG